MLEKKLYEKAVKEIKKLRGLRKRKVEDIFDRILYLGPEDFRVVNYKRSTPVAVFNPGVILRENKCLIFPRIIFDYYKYVSSIGFTEIDIEKILNNELNLPLDLKILAWPKELWEFLGCEDPRATYNNGKIYLLYTGKGYYLKNEKYNRRDVLALLEYTNSLKLLRKGYFRITNGLETFLPKSNKDSTFIEIRGENARLLTRPEIRNLLICWRASASISDLTIDFKSLDPVLVSEKWELKVGWSTNTVKISSNEYIVGWHGVSIDDYGYRNGLALVNEEGELLAVTNYLLEPRNLVEEYGDRILVIFGNGLLKHKDLLIWIGGISDYAIGFFVAEFDKVMEKMKWVYKNDV